MNQRTLYLSPNLHSTQEHLLSQVAALKHARPLLPVHLLLPTTQAALALRRHAPQALGLHFLQFYALAESILGRAALPITRIYEPSVRELVEDILARLHLNGELTAFTSVWDKPGFTQVIIEWLREMKTQGIHPQDFWDHSHSTEGQRERQLAVIYRDYQTYLQERRLSDADGLLWLAAEALENDPQLGHSNGHLYVSGFDQFNPIQMRLLGSLCKRYAGAAVYLLWDHDRDEDSLALARMRDARYSLEEVLEAEVVILENTRHAHPAVRHLRQSLFESGESPYRASDTPPIHAIEAPSREAELRWALREIKRLLLEGVSPFDITLLAPRPQAYQPLLRSISFEYGLPVQIDQILAESPAVSALINGLRLAPEFPWRATLDALRSPYIDQPWLNSEQVDLLDQLSRERPVVAGREQWQFALQPIHLPDGDLEDEDLGRPPLASQVLADALAELEAGLMAFFDHLTPPETGSYLDHALWVQEAFLGLHPEREDSEHTVSLDIAARCQEQADFSLRDLGALELLLETLRSMITSAQVVSPEAQPLTWESFRAKFIRNLSVPMPSETALQEVRFGPLEAGRDTVCDYLFILGMSEGEFPQPPPPDALYSPREREQHPLPLLRNLPALDASLWWQLMCSFRRELYLLRPRLDENGAPWLPSPYWSEVLNRLSNVHFEIIPIGFLPDTRLACSPGELLLALAVRHAQSVPPELDAQWRAARFAADIMRQRSSWEPPGAYEGYIQDPALRTELSQSYSPSYGWSVSKLNSYGSCPYGFFAQAVLGLKARPDPQEGLDPMQRGSLLHAMLELLFRRVASHGLSVTVQDQSAILELLEDVCEEIFPSAPQRYGFRPSALWRHEQVELRRLVENLVVWECEQNGDAARFKPYKQELRFGVQGTHIPSQRLDPESGEAFYIRGVIDRVDRDEGGSLRVIDYKSGSGTLSIPDIRRGYALQSALYALAAKGLVPDAVGVARSYYLHIPSRQRSGDLKFEEDPEAEEIVQEALDISARFVSLIRAGIFPSAPGKPAVGARACRDLCDFAALCRVTRQSIGKARRALT